MADNGSRDPWPDATYKGFAGAAPSARREPEPPPPRRRGPSRGLLIGGVTAAVVLGVGFGFLSRPQLVGSENVTQQPPATVPPPADALPAPAQVPIAVAPPAPPPGTSSVGRLPTLPPQIAEPPARAAPEPQIQPRPSAPIPRIAPPAPAAPAPAEPPPAIVRAEPQPVPRFSASFDCETARAGAEQMVCSDPDLAAADRQLARAYRRALRAGVDPTDLRQEQRDWVSIREEAARHSRRAVASVYNQRIEELNEIAENGADFGR